MAELGSNGLAGQAQEAVEFADVILLSVLWKKLDQVLDRLGSLDGKVVIDAINPLTTTETIVNSATTKNQHFFEFLGESSVSQKLQKRLLMAKIVKAFNQFYVGILAAGTQLSATEKPAVFYAGDGKDAKRIVSIMTEKSGFTAADAGFLQSARLLEMIPQLYHQVSQTNGWQYFGFTLSKIPHFVK